MVVLEVLCKNFQIEGETDLDYDEWMADLRKGFDAEAIDQSANTVNVCEVEIDGKSKSWNLLIALKTPLQWRGPYGETEATFEELLQCCVEQLFQLNGECVHGTLFSVWWAEL